MPRKRRRARPVPVGTDAAADPFGVVAASRGHRRAHASWCAGMAAIAWALLARPNRLALTQGQPVANTATVTPATAGHSTFCQAVKPSATAIEESTNAHR